MSPSVFNSNIVYAKGDSGSTSHYLTIDNTRACLNDIQPYRGPTVVLPDAETISSTLKGQLSLSTKLSKTAQAAWVLPALKSPSLISLGKLCDNNCIVILDKTKLIAIKEDEIILHGRRNYLDGLWDIPIQKTTLHKNNYEQQIHHGISYGRKYEKNNFTTTEKSWGFTTAEISAYANKIIQKSLEITPKEEKSFSLIFRAK